jgi:hypothetical protein
MQLENVKEGMKGIYGKVNPTPNPPKFVAPPQKK